MNKQPMDEKIMAYINYTPNDLPETRAEETWTEQQITTAIRGNLPLLYRGKSLQFIPFSVLEQQITLYVPDEFRLMSHDLAALKYPGEPLPQIICSDPAGEVNAIFSHTHHPLTADSVCSFQQTLAANITKMQPSAEILSAGPFDHPELPLAYVEALLPALDGQTYNLLYCFPLRRTAVIGSINCPRELMPFWQSAAKAILTTLKVQPN